MYKWELRTSENCPLNFDVRGKKKDWIYIKAKPQVCFTEIPEGVATSMSSMPSSSRTFPYPKMQLSGRMWGQGFGEAPGILNLGGPLVGGAEILETWHFAVHAMNIIMRHTSARWGEPAHVLGIQGPLLTETPYGIQLGSFVPDLWHVSLAVTKLSPTYSGATF